MSIMKAVEELIQEVVKPPEYVPGSVRELER